MLTKLMLPPIEVLDTAGAELYHDAITEGRQDVARSINKALFHLHGGLAIVPTAGGFLVPSGTRGGIVHRVDTVSGCSCEAGSNGRVCWHAQAIAIIEEAQRHTMPKMTPARPVVKPAEANRTTSIGFRKALADINELF